VTQYAVTIAAATMMTIATAEIVLLVTRFQNPIVLASVQYLSLRAQVTAEGLFKTFSKTTMKRSGKDVNAF